MLGKTMLWNTIKMEEALTELLRIEIKLIKKHIKNSSLDDIQIHYKLIKHIIMTLTLTDDRIKDGIELIKLSYNLNSPNKPEDNRKEVYKKKVKKSK